jgi:predicted metalloendopeptidase
MQFDINSLTWMDNTTKGRALTKLSMVDHLIGSPADPDTYAAVQVGQDYFTNVQNAELYAVQGRFNTIGQATNKQAWEMTAPTGAFRFPFFLVGPNSSV